MVNLDSYAPPLTPISVSLSHKHAQMNIHLKPLLPHTQTHTETKPDSYLLSRGDRYWISCFLEQCACVCVCLGMFMRVCVSPYMCFCIIISACVRICMCMSTSVCVPLPIYIHSCGEFSPHRCVRLCVFVSVWEARTIGVCGYELSLISRRPVLAKQSWHSAAPTSYLSLGIRH